MSLEATIKEFGSYELVFVAVHLVAAFVVSFRTRFSGKQIRLFFFLQPIAFPWGIFGLFYSPMYVVRGASLSLDREAFIDVPFIWITSHSIWIVTAVFVGWYLSRRALDDEDQVS